MRVIRFAHTAINMLSHIIARRSHVFALKVQHSLARVERTVCATPQVNAAFPMVCVLLWAIYEGNTRFAQLLTLNGLLLHGMLKRQYGSLLTHPRFVTHSYISLLNCEVLYCLF